MRRYNITILVGGGITLEETIEEGEISHCYPSTRICFTIDKFDFN